MRFLSRMEVFFVYLAANQNNCNHSTSEAECKERADWSEHQEANTKS